MSVGMALAIGAAGSILGMALALLLFEERTPVDLRPPWDLAGLLVCLALNAGGWVYAVVAVGS